MHEIPRNEIAIAAGEVDVAGTLAIPDGATGVVLSTHLAAAERFDPRARRLALALGARGFATLVLDLLSFEEERVDQVDASVRFDVPLLADRLIRAIDWTRHHAGTRLPLGLLAEGPGAAAALIAAARRPDEVAAVVARGGRPDLAGAALPRVVAPTLLVVGGGDPEVLELNHRAADRMTAFCRITIVPGVGHGFDEPGALDEVIRLAAAWFDRFVTPPAPEARL